jgi:hypothetical protein
MADTTHVSKTLTANGTAAGIVTVNDTSLFRKKARVYLSGTSLATVELEVADILSATTLAVRNPAVMGTSRFDCSAYTTAASAAIVQPTQADFYSVTLDVPDTIRVLGNFKLDTVDASGTPGAATINEPSGKVAIAAGASSVVVTNNLVTASSIIIPVLQVADATLTQILRVVPGAGSFTITGNANATAATKVAFIVIN